MREKLLEYLQREDLNPELQMVHDILGMDAVKRLLLELDGETIYIRRPERLGPLIRRYVREQYRRNPDGGDNVREIARTVGMSPDYVRKCLGYGESRTE